MKIIRKNNRITTFSKEHSPVVSVSLEENFIVETIDCYCGQIKNKKDLRSQIDSSLVNASTGPIFIKDTFPGDIICVTIHKIRLDSQGLILTFPGLGPLGDLIFQENTRILPVKDGLAYFNEKIIIPVNPMIGVIGVAPVTEEVSCESPGDHGGNMDTKDIKEGSKVYLPIFVKGGNLAIGDLHAIMGDGELSGMAIEIGGKVELGISKVENHFDLKMPIVETESEYLVIASEENFEKAAKKGIWYATELLQKNLNISFEDAYCLLSATCDLRVSQIVNPLITIRVAIPKSILSILF